ncbi:putative bifunctional diguanylate cyclase/phosphodiesterase [Streptomyces sp. CMB-StM0423]|uniref:putative bifunctional diguanylate cyclase/phosphodiesterase n=1 Tax=Streptomyces sp. CMB-StM0423 TaxID=2059884 RepID=UPI000C711C0B|nr:EAL domain-containing protein [Streptomyces sp. CMB-StM0423]AUH40311.1 phosphodiesterase [Streptomyces sp. CMB-StM0423]
MTASIGAVVPRPPLPAGVVPQLVLAVLCAGYATGAALGWGSSRVALIMGDFGLSAAAFAAAFSCLHYARIRQGRFRPAWLMFGVSSAMAGIGNGIWGWYEVVLQRPLPEASVADFFFLLFAPPAVIGLLVLARRPVSRAGWICLGLDTWLIGGSLLTISWTLALAHAAGDDESVPRVALSLAYPLLDIVLVSMVLALHFRRTAAGRSAINTAIGALVLTVLCDALFTSPLLQEQYRSGQLLDAGWFAGSVLLAYAPWVGRAEEAEEAEERGQKERGRPIAGHIGALAPYLAAGVCTLGILYNLLDGRSVDRVVLMTACTVVLALVVRQAIMLLDNISLTQELAQKENHFRSLVQGSSDVIMIAAPSGVLRYVSPAAQGVYGTDPEELVGCELAGLIHPDDLGRVLHEVRRFLSAPPGGARSIRIECRFRAGRGRRGGRAGGEGGYGEDGWLNVESTVNRHHNGLIFNSRDVTERVRLQAQLQHSASHDALTDLPNRALFTERVGHALGGRRAGDANAAVLFIDLDGFKAVNDTVGHAAGDELLIQAGRRLQESIRSGDSAARLGGDEFAVLLVGGAAGENRSDGAGRERRTREVADRLRVRLSEPYTAGGVEVRVAASIGVAFAEPGSTPAELMRNADLAMYRAKQAGKARVELYAPQMQAEVVRRIEMANRLRSALDDGQFTLVHQPVVELSSGRLAALSAQPRWRSAQGIVHTPAEFMQGPPDTGGRGSGQDRARTAELARWLLEATVEQAAERYEAGMGIPVTVRMSAARLTDRSMSPQLVEALLVRHGLPPGALTVEVADSDTRVGMDELERRLVALRRLGVRIALDGFGSGHAAIAALRRLPVDVLKLDRGLVDGLAESPRLRAIAAGMIGIAGELGLDSTAEGVDLPEQAEVLRALGCRHAQGMAYCEPLEEERVRDALALGAFALPEEDASAIALT